MYYLLILLAVALFTVQTICFKKFNLDYMKNTGSYFLFNTMCCILIAVIFLIKNGGFTGCSKSTALWGIGYGVIYVLTVYSYTKALETGPMAYSALIFSASLLIPAAAGCFFWNEKVGFFQITGLALLLVTFYFINTTGQSNKLKINLRWLFYALFSFFGNGSLSVIVKVHQTSLPGKEISEFLIIAFGTAAVMSILFFIPYYYLKAHKVDHLKKLGFALVVFGAGAATAFGSATTLYLSSRIPAVLLFPVLNGGIVLLSIVASLLIFKEKLSRNGVIGLTIGIIAICFLSL